MKRSLMWLLVLLPVLAQAQFTFTTNADNTITITGYTGSDGVVVIPSVTNGYPVTSIGLTAFWGCTQMTSVTIPNSITNIESAAFNSCVSLTNVAIPASVTSIGDYAFFYCTNLTAINVDEANPNYSSADGVLFNKDQTILMQFPFGKAGSYAIPDTVTSLADEAFGMNDHGQYPFPYSACAGLTNLTVPGSITNIGDSAFSHCAGLTSVTLSNGISSIGTNAFSWCINLASITIPSSVTSISELAFYYSGLTNITIPGSVTNMGTGAFAVCSSLSTVDLEAGVGSIGEAGFNFCTNLTSVSIPDSLTSIGDRAFWFCTGLTNVSIPGNVTNIGQYAFSGCASLMNINVSVDNLFYRSDDGVLFNQDATTLIQFPGGRGGSYSIPVTVTNIGDFAFGKYDQVLNSSDYFLPSCASLTNITFGSHITTIGFEYFSSLTDLTSVHFEGDAPTDAGDLSFIANVTIFYLPGTTGWEAFLPTALWLPEMKAAGASFEGQTNQFGFNINWARGLAVVVEACTNLSNPVWQPVQTNALTTGSANFSDPQRTNYPGRFYRLRSP